MNKKLIIGLMIMALSVFLSGCFLISDAPSGDEPVVSGASSRMYRDLDMQGNDLYNVSYINFTNDATNHNIYDNTTCIIISGDTSELVIC